MSLIPYFFASRQAVVLGASACVALSTVLVSLNEGNRAPLVASNAPGVMTAPEVPAAVPSDVSIVSTRVVATVAATTSAPASPPLKSDPTANPVAQLQSSQTPNSSVSQGQEIGLGKAKDDTVHKPQPGGLVIASIAPGGALNPGLDLAPSLHTAPLGKPSIGPLTKATPDTKLSFDLVRVDKSGSAVVAGKATPGQVVGVNIDGVEVAQAQTNSRGSFVAMFMVPDSENTQIITLFTRDSVGTIHMSPEQVIVVRRKTKKPAQVIADAVNTSNDQQVDAPPVPEKDVAPAIILSSDKGVKMVQPAAPQSNAPEVMANVSLDLISYDKSGEVVLTGRSKPDSHVRVYVDDKPVKMNAVAKDGSWQMSLPEVDAGRYTLRIDEIDPTGKVTSRLETPFQKEVAAEAKRVASNAALATADGAAPLPNVQKITIQRGATLWGLAEKNYGKGDLYMQIFNANRDTIRDPNLIYPGQIFKIPD